MIMNGQGGDYEMMSGTGLSKGLTINIDSQGRVGLDQGMLSDIRLALIDFSVIRSTASADPP